MKNGYQQAESRYPSIDFQSISATPVNDQARALARAQARNSGGGRAGEYT
jgi:hypothetical protein